MGDHFLSLLPAGHAIRSITLVAARASLGGEPAFVVPVGPAVIDARLQCAAIAWALGGAYSSAAVHALPATARTYLARIFGVTSGSKTAAALTARIDGHILAHHPALGAAAPGAVNPSVIGFIGPPVPAVAASAAPAQAVGGGPPAYVAPHPGAAGPGFPGDDTGGFASALLAPPQVHALLALPPAELQKLLDAAGVPHSAAHTGADLRTKCAAAAWAAEKLRSIDDVRTLDGGLQARLLSAFEVPVAWKPEARLHAMTTVLQGCRDSAWAQEPHLSFGLVHAARSALFRISEKIRSSAAGATTTPDAFLSPREKAEFDATLAGAGYTNQDLVHDQGRWSLATGGGPRSPAVGTSAAGQLKVEKELRTLYINPYLLLTAAERKEQASRSKTVLGKRQGAYPGDVVTDVADVGLNPFADWPWEQALQFNADLPYKRAGRLMRNMLRWCNQHCSCQIMVMTHESRKAAAALLYESFSGAVDIGDHARALLIAMQSTAEAGEQMKCILANALRRAVEYPNSPMLVYIAQRRAAQSDELRVFLAECSTRITEASKDKLARPNSATASWIDFLGGWLSKADTDLVDPESLEQAARTPSRPLLGPPTPYQTPTPVPLYSQGPATGATPPATGGGGNGGAGRGAGGKGAGNSGGGYGAGGATGPVTRAISVVIFRRHIPCSGEIIGTTLGVNSAAPPCRKCNVGNHYHGECPVWWGNQGTALPGFDIHGQRIPGEWHGSSNEPLRKTIKAWVAFLEDLSNFNNAAPIPAGVAGAPDLGRFQARALTAPVKP